MSLSAPDVAASPAMHRVVIVDDEPLARDCIRLALAKATDVAIVAECSDGVGAVNAIRAYAPDIVFLDVQMPGLDGFGVIDRIGAESMPPVVFVTAYDAHAMRAFEVHALDYVLKPFDDERLLSALDHARSVVRDRQHGELGRRLSEVLRTWHRDAPAREAPDELDPDDESDGASSESPKRAAGSSYIARFAVRGGGRVRFVPAADVDWIEADGNYAILHVGETKHRIRAALRQIIAELDPKRFVRTHRSVIVNVERIRELQPWFGGDYIAILRTGAKLKVSRLRAAQLLRPMA